MSKSGDRCRQDAPTAQQRDRRLAHALQTCIDRNGDEMRAIDRRGARYFRLAVACLRQLDDLAVSQAQLMIAMAPVEARLIKGQATAAPLPDDTDAGHAARRLREPL